MAYCWSSGLPGRSSGIPGGVRPVGVTGASGFRSGVFTDLRFNPAQIIPICVSAAAPAQPAASDRLIPPEVAQDVRSPLRPQVVSGVVKCDCGSRPTSYCEGPPLYARFRSRMVPESVSGASDLDAEWSMAP
jgi:hypothetical protein